MAKYSSERSGTGRSPASSPDLPQARTETGFGATQADIKRGFLEVEPKPPPMNSYFGVPLQPFDSDDF